MAWPAAGFLVEGTSLSFASLLASRPTTIPKRYPFPLRPINERAPQAKPRLPQPRGFCLSTNPLGTRRIGSANHLQELNRAPSLVVTLRRLAIDGGDGAYVALALPQTCLDLAATEGRTRRLRLDLSGSRRGRGYARIGTGSKPVVANTLSSCITETGRKRARLSAGRNCTSNDARPNPLRCNAQYLAQITTRTHTA